MNVKFLPEGGFNKNGAFVEYEGDDPPVSAPEYERASHISFTATCADISLQTSMSVRDDVVDPKPEDLPSRVSMNGYAVLEGDLYGQWCLSFLGKEKVHDQIRVWIHQSNAKEKVHFSGFFMERDFDSDGIDEFFIEVSLTPDRFADIRQQMSHPGADLQLRINPSLFPNFYATWSPSNREGRVIKFLDDQKIVENSQDIPEGFNLSKEKREVRSEGSLSALSLHVRRPLQSLTGATDGVSPEEHADVDRLEAGKPKPQQLHTDQPAIPRELEALLGRLVSRVTVILAVVILMCLLLLGGLLRGT